MAKPTERERNWVVVDANGKTLGRMATQIADVLRGKRKPEYTPHIDTGDFVVVVNAEKVAVTGNKRADKRYYRHSGYPGRPALEDVRGDAGEAARGDHPAGRERHDAAQPSGAQTADEAEDLRRPRAPARGPEPATFGDRGLMADDQDTPETLPRRPPPRRPLAEGHAVPTEDATEIAGSAEDAALEARQESQEHPGSESAKPEQFEPIAGNAVPSEEATEIAGSAEDAPLEAWQERAEEQRLEEVVVEAVAEEIVAEAVEEVRRGGDCGGGVAEVEAELEAEEMEADEEAAPRVKPAVPGAHLEVDIVPEGVDPLGRGEARSASTRIRMRSRARSPSRRADGQEEQEEVLTEPIATAAIDLASGARYRATGKRKTAVARVTLRPGKRHLPRERAHARGALSA